ncbi:MAG: hypothetical protein ACD_10C00479G0010 [uncultured bacterium]|nr:MAG: hypothetical protein ACD_10C00479G0010 [uncultured bacterium]
MQFVSVPVLFMALAIAGCTTSSAIMTGQARTATPASEVKVYLRSPAQFESIALVTAMSNAAVSRDGSRENAVAELKKKAGELGANGILLNTNETNPGLQTGVFVPGATRGAPGVFVGGGAGLTVEMQAEAIFVTGQ